MEKVLELSRPCEEKHIALVAECPICLQEFALGNEQPVCQLECHEAHIFHTDCLTKYLDEGNHECPNCRASIIRI